MKLALMREQTAGSYFSLVPLRIGSGVVFKLRATLEPTQEESRLLDMYDLARAPLVTGDTVEDLRRGFRQALVLGVIAFFVVLYFTTVHVALTISAPVLFVMTLVYFWHEREQITVSDLLINGRVFRCDSVVALIEKEAEIANMASHLRQVLESAKHWSDREVIPIEPLDPALLKQAILSARRR